MLMTESVGKLGDAEPVCKERKRLNITVTDDVFHSWKFLCKSLPRPTLSKLYRMKLKCDIPGYVVCKVQHGFWSAPPAKRDGYIWIITNQVLESLSESVQRYTRQVCHCCTRPCSHDSLLTFPSARQTCTSSQPHPTDKRVPQHISPTPQIRK